MGYSESYLFFSNSGFTHIFSSICKQKACKESSLLLNMAGCCNSVQYSGGMFKMWASRFTEGTGLFQTSPGLRSFFLTFSEAVPFCEPLHETFLERIACHTRFAGDECRVLNLPRCCDLTAGFVMAEDAWRCSHLLWYYLHGTTTVMKLRVWLSTTSQSLSQLLKNRVPGELMGIGGSWCLSGLDFHPLKSNYCPTINTAFPNSEYVFATFFLHQN